MTSSGVHDISIQMSIFDFHPKINRRISSTIVKNDLMEVVQELKRFGDSVKACEAELILNMFTNGEQVMVC